MGSKKEELIKNIEHARQKLNESIDQKERYDEIYEKSVQLDLLIEQYIVAGF